MPATKPMSRLRIDNASLFMATLSYPVYEVVDFYCCPARTDSSVSTSHCRTSIDLDVVRITRKGPGFPGCGILLLTLSGRLNSAPKVHSAFDSGGQAGGEPYFVSGREDSAPKAHPPSASGGQAGGEPSSVSGREDSNLRLPAPKAGALTGLSYAPSEIRSVSAISA